MLDLIDHIDPAFLLWMIGMVVALVLVFKALAEPL